MATSSCSTMVLPRRRATESACSACLYAAETAMGPQGADMPTTTSASSGTGSRTGRSSAVRAWAAQASTAAPPSAARTTRRSPSGTISRVSPDREAAASIVSASSSVPEAAGDSAISSRKGASRSPPYRSPATARAWSDSPASSILRTAAPRRCSAPWRARERAVVRVSRATAECTA